MSSLLILIYIKTLLCLSRGHLQKLKHRASQKIHPVYNEMTFQGCKTHHPEKPERPLLDLLKVTPAWKTASLPKRLDKVVAIMFECIIKSDNYLCMLTVGTSDFIDYNKCTAAVLDGLALIKQTNSECPRPGPQGQQMVPRIPILTLA